MPRFRSWIVTLLVLLLGSTAGAQAPSAADDKKAQRLFDRGNKSYDRGRYADALADYKASYEAAPRPATLFNLAQTEARVGLDESAYAHFTTLIADDTAPAKLRTLAKGQLADIRKRLRVPVQVSSDPPGAQVYFDDAAEATGTTPLISRLAPGPHKVRLVHQHAPPVEQAIEAEVGRDVSISVPLDVTAQVTITPTPATAQMCLLEGTAEGMPACKGRGPEGPGGAFIGRLAPGEYLVGVRADGHVPRSLRVVATRGGVIAHEVGLAPLSESMGVLSVTGTEDAAVFVNERPVGTTPLEHVSLPAGEYLVSVKRPGHRGWEGHARVLSDKTTRVKVRLEPERERWAKVGSGTLAGTGAIGLTMGSLLGVLAMQDAALYGEEPTRSRADRGSTRAVVADTLFVVGGVSLVSAIVMWRSTKPGDSAGWIEVQE